MASGDRIELLTAGTFETAMDSQETILNNVSTKVNTINTNVAQSLTDISTAYTDLTKDISTVYQAETTNYGVLSDLSIKMGSSNNTGGTATAGTVMGKLNTLINNTENIRASVGDTSLYSTIFIPSDKLLKTILNTQITLPLSTSFIGTFIAKYSGQLLISVTGSATNSMYRGGLHIGINYISSDIYPCYPSMGVAHNQNDSSNYFERYHSIGLNSSMTLSTESKYVSVKAGDILYFYIYGQSANNSVTFHNVSVYGSTISYY